MQAAAHVANASPLQVLMKLSQASYHFGPLKHMPVKTHILAAAIPPSQHLNVTSDSSSTKSRHANAPGSYSTIAEAAIARDLLAVGLNTRTRYFLPASTYTLAQVQRAMTAFRANNAAVRDHLPDEQQVEHNRKTMMDQLAVAATRKAVGERVQAQRAAAKAATAAAAAASVAQVPGYSAAAGTPGQVTSGPPRPLVPLGLPPGSQQGLPGQSLVAGSGSAASAAVQQALAAAATAGVGGHTPAAAAAGGGAYAHLALANPVTIAGRNPLTPLPVTYAIRPSGAGIVPAPAVSAAAAAAGFNIASSGSSTISAAMAGSSVVRASAAAVPPLVLRDDELLALLSGYPWEEHHVGLLLRASATEWSGVKVVADVKGRRFYLALHALPTPSGLGGGDTGEDHSGIINQPLPRSS